jgi:Pyruvate/2-oxoacid:ferredoxin oxidoreductase delta subunit
VARAPQQVSFSYSSDDTVRLEAELLDRFRQMENSDFAPKPSRTECSRCDVAVPFCPERNRHKAPST